MKKICPKSSGFTLIELLVVVSIIGILFTVGLAFYNDFNRRQIVVQSAKALKDTLRLVQSKALAGEKDSSICGSGSTSKTLDGWFINFSGSEYRVYGKCGGVEFSSVITTLPTGFILTSPSTNPLPFRPLVGGVELVVGLTEDKICIFGFGKYYRLKITPSGEIKDEGFQSSC